MTIEDFEALLTEAELHPHRASGNHGIAFSVSHHVPIEILRLDGTVVRSLRVQCEWIIVSDDELGSATLQSSQSQIEGIKKKLEKAAMTKQGVTKWSKKNIKIQ